MHVFINRRLTLQISEVQFHCVIANQLGGRRKKISTKAWSVSLSKRRIIPISLQVNSVCPLIFRYKEDLLIPRESASFLLLQ